MSKPCDNWLNLDDADTNIPGWTVITTVEYQCEHWESYDEQGVLGQFASVLLNNRSRAGGIKSDAFLTSVGQVYRLSFMMSGRPGAGDHINPKGLDIKINDRFQGRYWYDTVSKGTGNPTPMNYVSYGLDFIAASASTVIEFRSLTHGTTVPISPTNYVMRLPEICRP